MTAKSMELKTSTRFGAGPLKSDAYVDDMRIGSPDGKGPNVFIKDMNIGAAYECSFMSGKPGELEAVIGLSYPNLGTKTLGDSILGFIDK